MNRRRNIDRPTDEGGDNRDMIQQAFIKSYMDMIPSPDEMTNIVYWDKSVLNEIDSLHIQMAYQNCHAYYKSLHDVLVNSESSPYKNASALEYPEFCWALNTVSSRHIVMHGHDMDNDPNQVLMMMPFMDLLNHAPTANTAIYPLVDKMHDNHSYLVLKALKDIEEDEQLTISYGNLSNMHLIQKYGFTLQSDE